MNKGGNTFLLVVKERFVILAVSNSTANPYLIQIFIGTCH